MFGLGGWEIMVIVAAGLLFFGPKKLPQLMRQAGKVMHEVKKASSEFQFSIERELEDDEFRRAHRRAKKKARKLEEKGISAPDGPAAFTGPDPGMPQPGEEPPDAVPATPRPAAATSTATPESAGAPPDSAAAPPDFPAAPPPREEGPASGDPKAGRHD